MKIGEIEYSSLKTAVSELEWQTRVDLAAVFRLIPLMGWWDVSQAPAAARIPGTQHYLFNPSGILFEEVTPSSLVKIDVNGDKVDASPFTHLKANWYPFKAVFSVRTDVDWVLHSHDDWIAALSSRREGLLPISQCAAIALGVGTGFHEYDGIEILEKRIPSLQESLGTSTRVLLLQGHGLMSLGTSAYGLIGVTSLLSKACRIQVLAGRGVDLLHINAEIQRNIVQDLSAPGAIDNLWPALLRRLDRLDNSWRY